MAPKPGTIDEYLSGVPKDQASALQRLRGIIRSVVPDAEECFSYGMPAFCHEGRALVAFAARAGHCALYPMSGTIVAVLGGQLSAFDTSKGTIRFQPDHPLPDSLVRRIVRLRIAENHQKGTK